MTKLEFLSALRDRLSGLPKGDLERSIEYYNESIEDRMEDGLTEEEAVAAMGTLDEAVSQILADTPLPRLVQERVRPKRVLKAWNIVLLVLGSPIWLTLLLAAGIILLSVYIVFWAVVIVLYAAVAAFVCGGLAGIFAAISLAVASNLVQGLWILGAGLVCAGLAILMFHCGNWAAMGTAILGKKLLLGIKLCFVRKGAAV